MHDAHLILSFASNVDLGSNLEFLLLTMTQLCAIYGDVRLTVNVLQQKVLLRGLLAWLTGTSQRHSVVYWGAYKCRTSTEVAK